MADPGRQRLCHGAHRERVLRRLPVAGVRGQHPAHRQRPDAVRHLRLRPRHQLGVAPDPALDPENRIAGLGKTARPPCSPNWCSPSATASTTSTAIRTTTSNSWRWSAPASAYPDILNYDQVVKVTGSFKTPMGCRSFLGTYEQDGELVHDGRNNIGVISSTCRASRWRRWAMSRASGAAGSAPAAGEKALMTRIARLEGIKARVAPILYMEGACGVRLKADDNIADIFKNGRASISLGYIGLHETINALFGGENHVYDDEALRAKAVAIVARLRAAVDAWKDRPATASASTARRAKPVRSLLPAGHRRFRRGAGRHRQGLLHQQLPPRRGRRSIRTTSWTSKRPTRRWPAAASSATANTRTCSTT